MRPLLAALLVALAALLAPAARGEDRTWSGTWDTRWRDGGARMILEQRGDAVTGAYPAYGGRIEGTVHGRTLTGRWIEGPRSSGMLFVLAPDGQAFMGRFDNGEWWTGGRVSGARAAAPVDQTGAREALRTFVVAGNAARSGDVDAIATAASVLDMGPAGAAMIPGQKLAAASALFALVDLTTVHLWSIPGKRAAGDRLDLSLKQAGTDAALPLALVKRDGLWFVAMPDADVLASARKALLARSGGRLPPPDDYKRRRTARDALRSFAAAFYEWEDGGHGQALDTLDLSALSEATRDYEGTLAAEYLNGTLSRIGSILPQEVPDDPASRDPYVVFSHPAGQIVIAPVGTGDATAWQFTAGTVRAARDLYTAIEDMPAVEGAASPVPPSGYFRVRRWVRDHAPALLARLGPLEAWQAVGVAAVLIACFAAAYLAGWVLLAVLRQALGGRRVAAEREFRLPLRLALAFALYQVLIAPVGLPEGAKRVSVGLTRTLLALAVIWGGWKLIDTVGRRFLDRTERAAGTMDGIAVSLVLAALKLAVLGGGLTLMANALSLPYEGVLAGLGIGGLAVAFASKETLSNVFGAGILVADRPFRRGDWIATGETQGTVEHVGVRSTRIRTAEDSLVFVPNGKLTDATINNLGTRRSRLAKLTLPVAYDTPPDRLDAFMADLARAANAVPGVLADRTQVGVAGLGTRDILVEIETCLGARSDAEERALRTALALQVLRAAERLRLHLGDPRRTPEPPHQAPVADAA